MARNKRDPGEVAIAKAIIDEYNITTVGEAEEALRRIMGPAIEAMLKGELDAHLGYESNDKSEKPTCNRRNGYTPKQVKTSFGKVGIEVPRDRDGSFEPVVVPKGESDLSDIEQRVLSMYARGMSQRDIASMVREIYGFSISPETVSAITDRIWEELHRWQTRPLEPVYAFVFVDCLFVPVREAHSSRRTAVYAMLAYDLEGNKDVLGIWMDEEEGARRWMQIFDEVRGRGVEDILFVSMDGLAGLEDGVHAVFPDAIVQRCMVHLVRNSRKFVPHKESAAFCASIRAVYGAASLEAAREAWEAFRREWGPRYPAAVAVWERSEEHIWQLFDHGSAVRKIMYTTNPVESMNASFRKVVRRGSFPDREAVMKLLYLRVRELYAKWGEMKPRNGWSTVLSQLMCDDGIRRRIEPYV